MQFCFVPYDNNNNNLSASHCPPQLCSVLLLHKLDNQTVHFSCCRLGSASSTSTDVRSAVRQLWSAEVPGREVHRAGGNQTDEHKCVIPELGHRVRTLSSKECLHGRNLFVLLRYFCSPHFVNYFRYVTTRHVQSSLGNCVLLLFLLLQQSLAAWL